MSAEFYELRRYRIATGRMEDMRARLRGPLRDLFATHGIRPLGCWQSLVDADDPWFIYLTPWASFTQRQAAWSGFYADPAWHRAREQTNRGSELVTRYALNFFGAGISS